MLNYDFMNLMEILVVLSCKVSY